MQAFESIVSQLEKTQVWTDMVAMTEDTEYHREANVATHTRMMLKVVEDKKILTLLPHLADALTLSDREAELIKITCWFHDVAKPHCMKMRYTEARGSHKAFHGHEEKSAKMYSRFISATDIEYFRQFTTEEHTGVWFLIAKHLWFQQNVKKLAAALCAMTSAAENVNSIDWVKLYCWLVVADVFGRIADKAEQKQAEMLIAVDALLAEVERLGHCK